MLPEGWKLTTVGEVCSIKNNLRLPISSEERDLIQGQFPYFGPTGILGYINHYKIDEEFVLIGEDGDHFLKFKDKEMTLLFSGKANVNNHAHIIANSEHCLAQWFHLFFVHRDITSFLTRQGAKRYKLTKAALEKLPLTLPQLPEQKKIAQILSTWDKAITVTEQLIANSQQQKKALMQQLLTGKKRLLDDSGVRFSGEWEHSTLRNILTVSKGQQLNKDTLDSTGLYPVINGGITPSGYTDQKNRSANTITISEGGNSCGYVAFQTKDFWCGGHCYSATNLKLNLQFTYHCLKFNENRIMKLRVGSGLPNIQKKDIDGLVINYPNCHIEQQKIAAVLSVADREIEALQSKLTALKQEKKSLMQQLLAGKRRVRV